MSQDTTTNPHEIVVCPQTGLALVPANGQLMHRIAKASYGPLNPLLRDHGADRSGWGRYDVAGHRTVYGASPAAGAYAESLAVHRTASDSNPASAMNTALSQMFPDSDPSNAQTLAEAVQAEWDEKFHTAPGFLPAAWRLDRLEYRVELPDAGWFIDIEHSSSLAVLSEAIKPTLLLHQQWPLTAGYLRGDNRDVTTAAAGWIREQVLHDGALPHGIQYGSKWGSNFTCWAVWLRKVDDGDDPARDVLLEPTQADSGHGILDCEHNAPLRQIADLFRLRCH